MISLLNKISTYRKLTQETPSGDNCNQGMLARVSQNITNHEMEEASIQRRGKWSSSVGKSSSKPRWCPEQYSVKMNMNFDDVQMSKLIQVQYSYNRRVKLEVQALQNGLKEMKALLFKFSSNNKNYNINNNSRSSNDGNNTSDCRHNKNYPSKNLQRNSIFQTNAIIFEKEMNRDKNCCQPKKDDTSCVDATISCRRYHSLGLPGSQTVTPL